MESTVDDFLNEIDEIVPLKNDKFKKRDDEWEECFDAKSGFPYFWNVKTNEVTWEKPHNFVKKSSSNGPIPNIAELQDKVKIYRIEATKPLPKSNGSSSKVETKKISQKRRPHNDSDDEKITLITSYGSSASSESEDEKETAKEPSPKEVENQDDILSTVLKRAQELKNIGNADTKIVPKRQLDTVSKTPKPISGFSLVAGYDSNSEEESEIEEPKPAVAISAPQGHSTLFPIMQTPDLNDFKEEQKKPEKEPEMENSFDMKNFKRKRRLGVTFVPRNPPRPQSPNSIQMETKGLGFKDEEKAVPGSIPTASKSVYPNFTKGGVEFVKSETLDVNKTEESDRIDEKKIGEVYEILHEKLGFLCEGNKDVMPVQIILIQIETLYGAMKADCLKPDYLYDWLQGTSEDLIKLEKEAAPEGWSLQWDRLQKRYFYQNQENGQSQWEYPQAESERQEEAMDICTTPPPPNVSAQPIEEGEDCSNSMPSPPPAPIISKADSPEPQLLKPKAGIQPLPPGVDYVEPISKDNDIDSAFNTFYTELAEIEKTSQPSSPHNIVEQPEVVNNLVEPTEPVKKKRKKTKLGQGLSLKNKDVSKLVEKWKSVQNNY